MHSETGFLKLADQKIELSLSHPFSLCEIEEGLLD